MNLLASMMVFVTNEQRKGNITTMQAKMLQEYLLSMYLSKYLQATFVPCVEEFVEKTQQRLENKFDDLFSFFLVQVR